MSTTQVDKTITKEVPLRAQLWISSDTAKKSFMASYCLTGLAPAQPADVRKMKTQQFERTRAGVEQWIEWGKAMLPEDAELCIIMESTGPYSLEMCAWAQSVCPGITIIHMPARQIKQYVTGIGVRNKTDKLDARVIAVYGAERRPKPHEPSRPEYQDLRALTRARQQLTEMVTQVRNQHDTITSEHLSPKARKQLDQVNRKLLETLEQQIEKLEKDMKDLLKAHPDLQLQVELLETIDGVGFRTATAILGELGDLTRFKTCRQMTAYAGLNPVLEESSDTKKPAKISKRGSPKARRSLYMAAMVAIQYNDHYKQRYMELTSRGKSKMTALVAIMRHLLVLMRGVLKSKQPYNPTYKTPCGKPCATAP